MLLIKKILSISVLMVMSIMLGGCALKSMQSQSNFESNADMGTLVIYSRSGDIVQKNLGVIQVKVDGVKIGSLGFEEKVLIQLKPGYRKLEIYANALSLPWIKPDWDKYLEIDKSKKLIYAISVRQGPLDCQYATGFTCHSSVNVWGANVSDEIEPDLKLVYKYSE